MQSTSEEFQHTVPRIPGTRFVVNVRAGVIKEGVAGVLVDVKLSLFTSGFEFGFELLDGLRRNRRIVFGKEAQNRGL